MVARLRSFALAAAVVLATLAAPAATGGAVACAGEGPRAGLVVDTGARVIELCVTLDAAEVSGLRLIELASAQHGLSYGFGLGGAAVCRLDGVGTASDDCFAEYPEFWGYWHADGRGGWNWASTGAGSSRVGDGDMEGWVWGTGDSGATHRMPPALVSDDVCGPVTEPSPEPTQDPDPSPKPATSPTKTSSPTGPASSARASTEPDVPSSTREPKEDGTRTPSPGTTPSAETSTTTSDPPVLAAGTPPTGADGPPSGLLLAGGIAVALGAGGWLRLRSRAKDPG